MLFALPERAENHEGSEELYCNKLRLTVCSCVRSQTLGRLSLNLVIFIQFLELAYLPSFSFITVQHTITHYNGFCCFLDMLPYQHHRKMCGSSALSVSVSFKSARFVPKH